MEVQQLLTDKSIVQDQNVRMATIDYFYCSRLISSSIVRSRFWIYGRAEQIKLQVGCMASLTWVCWVKVD